MLLIVAFAGNDKHNLFGYLIHKTMFIANPSRPVALAIMLIPFRFPGSTKWVALAFLNESGNFVERFSVKICPCSELLKCGVSELNLFHSY